MLQMIALAIAGDVGAASASGSGSAASASCSCCFLHWQLQFLLYGPDFLDDPSLGLTRVDLSD